MNPDYCMWCGKKSSDHLIVIQGPGVTICEDCITLLQAVVDAEKEKRTG